MRLWLIGMMGSGKTSAGRLAASHLGVDFSDTDEFVAERMGCSVAQLWGTQGEQAFRAIEKVAMADVAVRHGIISTGGGVVLDQENRELLREDPKVVWLEASPAVLAGRLERTSDRPGLVASDKPTREFLDDLLDERRPLYEALAKYRVLTDSMETEEIAATIEEIWLD